MLNYSKLTCVKNVYVDGKEIKKIKVKNYSEDNTIKKIRLFLD